MSVTRCQCTHPDHRERPSVGQRHLLSARSAEHYYRAVIPAERDYYRTTGANVCETCAEQHYGPDDPLELRTAGL